jgi:hypothetical protein
MRVSVYTPAGLQLNTLCQALSAQVCNKFNIPGYYRGPLNGLSINTSPQTWLYQDWGTIMELSVKYGVTVTHYGMVSGAGFVAADMYCKEPVRYADCEGSQSLAERIVRLKSLMHIGIAP